MTVNMKWILTTVLLLVTAWLPLQIYAEVYKWVDDQGRTHYGEKPPAGAASEVEIKDTPEPEPLVEKSLEERNAERDKMLKIYDEERAQKKEEQQQAEKEKKERKRQCLEAENELQDLQQGGVYYDLDENGERRYKSDEEMAQRIKDYQAQYDKYCK